MKKNTLLYLDTEIVAKAKHHNLNISKITEDAIKSQLFPILSYGEKADANFWGYLKELEKEKNAFFLPQYIKEAKLVNIGPIKEIILNFEKFNIIIGKSATGKTTIVRAIAHAFKRELLKEYLSNNSKIELVVHPEKKYTLDMTSDSHKENIKCILIDCVGSRLDMPYFEKFLEYLKKLDIQVIMTEYGLKENISYKNLKVIELPNINKLKYRS